MYSCEERRHLERNYNYVNRTKLHEMLRVRLLNLTIDLHQYFI